MGDGFLISEITRFFALSHNTTDLFPRFQVTGSVPVTLCASYRDV